MPSVAKSRRLPEPYEFFVDRSLGGRTVVEALRAGCLPAETVHAHDDHFAQDAPDDEWLADVGARGWVVLTKDMRIASNSIERDALLTADVALFALRRGEISGPRMGEIFCSALAPIRTVLRRYPVAIVATVSVEGAVSVRIADGVELPRPKNYRPPARKPSGGG